MNTFSEHRNQFRDRSFFGQLNFSQLKFQSKFILEEAVLDPLALLVEKF
jgi:hypothetical protein